MAARRHNAFQRLFRGETSFDFVGRWRVWFAISGVIIMHRADLAGHAGLNFSIDFKGGTVWEVPSDAVCRRRPGPSSATPCPASARPPS